LIYPKFSICSFNVENLFIPPYSNEESYKLYKYQKDPKKVKQLAQAILDIDADVIFLCEVGGEDSLKNFVEKNLEQKYNYSLIKGNSDRGIELAYLTKVGLMLEFKHFTHKSRALDFNYPHEEKENRELLEKGLEPKHSPLLPSRDIAELRIFSNDSETPSMILLGVHLKSQLDKEGIDFGGRLRRKAELIQLIKTYNILNKRYNEKVPIILLGDFNGKAAKEIRDPEFDYLYENSSLEDVLEVINEPQNNRVSIHIFDKAGEDLSLQLDYIFLPESVRDKVLKRESGIYLYKNEYGAPLPRPTTLYERYQQPSDHFPVVCTFTNIEL
jgi:endonuclease/exonuclease/phosphatase family metal-dependent hydrolase